MRGFRVRNIDASQKRDRREKPRREAGGEKVL
jgi:hypothetical protein